MLSLKSSYSAVALIGLAKAFRKLLPRQLATELTEIVYVLETE
jgi:hypothetical protein